MGWLITAALCFVGYDIYTTRRRILKYGSIHVVEQNPIISYLSRKFGLLNGLIGYSGVTCAMWSFIAYEYHWLAAYAFYTGYLANHFVMQLQSIALEQEFDKLRRG